MNNVGKVRQQCWMISRPLDLPPPPATALNAAAPIWIYHYWQLESINPLIYPIRLSRWGNRPCRCFFIVFVCLSADGRRVRRRLGDMCHRHGRRRALILSAQRTVRREGGGSWVWSGCPDWLVIYWQILSVEKKFIAEFLQQGGK